MGDQAHTKNSTVRLPVAPVYGSSLNTEVTVFVLLTGILVGLLLVVIVLCVCKCCVKTSKPLKRQQVVFTKYSSERESTWNGNEAGCTKYHSMEARASPCSSVILDIEVGYVENSTGHSKERRDREDRLLDVVSLNPSPSSLNVRATSDRVFQECSRDSSPRSSVTEKPTIHYPSTSSSRTPEEIRICKSRRFPRSPPIQRQTSICLQDGSCQATSEQPTVQLERRGSMAALASPEESSSMDGTGSDDHVHGRKSSSSAAEETRVSAEVHREAEGATSSSSSVRKPRRQQQQHQQHRLSACDVQPLVSPIESPTVRMRYVLAPPDMDGSHCSRSLETRKKRPASSPETGGRSQQLLRPASAMDVRGTAGATMADQIRAAGSAEDGARLQAMLEARSREHSRRQQLLLRPGQQATAASDEDEEPRAKVRYNDHGSMEEVDDVEADVTCTTDTTTTSEGAALTPEVGEEGPEVTVTAPEVDLDDDDDDDDGDTRGESGVLDRRVAEQYRMLWQLRTTLEEQNDEETSDVAPPGEEEEEDESVTKSDKSDNNHAATSAVVSAEPETEEHVEEEEEQAATEEGEQSSEVAAPEMKCDPGSHCCSSAPEGALEELHLQGSTSQSPPPSGTSSPAGHQARRQSYKAILSKRTARASSVTPVNAAEQPQTPEALVTTGGGGSVDNSFDSLETEESASTDASRGGGLEIVTTSMESTCTDNTDSTGEGQVHHRLQQMKADSGYKSLEVQQVNGRSFSLAHGSCSSKRQIHFVLSADEGNSMDDGTVSTDDPENSQQQQQQQQQQEDDAFDAATAAAAMLSLPVHRGNGSHHGGHHHHHHHHRREKVLSPKEMTSIDSGTGSGTRTKNSHTTFSDRKLNGKSASRKRRDYTRERHVAETSFSINSITELEDPEGNGGGREAEAWDEQGKASVFLRFFRAPPPGAPPSSSSSSSRHHFATCRDFSVDEQTDALFREFSRRDPAYDLGQPGRCRSPRLHPRHRLYHRHLPDSGTSSGGEGGGGGGGGGGGSSRSVTRSKLSPQDSIEEEQGGAGTSGVHHKMELADLQLEAAEVHIPIIKVAGDDSSS